jgi:hypothetical protein
MMVERRRCQCRGDAWTPWMRGWRALFPTRFPLFASRIGLGTFSPKQLYSFGSAFLPLDAILQSIQGFATPQFPLCHKFG